tara:strand:- start:4477 stop:5274 length:798 start_codon:yes stop_codon:yes gene_type:complete
MESKELKLPVGWSAITLRQFSEYNKLCINYLKLIDEFEGKEENIPEKDSLEFKLNVCSLFSGASKEELNKMPVAFIVEYVNSLDFLSEEREPENVKEFIFKGKKYKFTYDLGLDTTFGQYIESVQSEFVSKHEDKNSLDYLAHQLAHTVKGEAEMTNKDRDKLALEFLDIPATLALDFAFFLQKKSRVYNLAYRLYLQEQKVGKQPFMKRTLKGLVGLKRYMNWQSVVYLISLTRLLLTVFYIRTQERFFNTYRFCRLKLTMSTK